MHVDSATIEKTFLWGNKLKRFIDSSFEQNDVIKGFRGTGSNRYLVTLTAFPKI